MALALACRDDVCPDHPRVLEQLGHENEVNRAGGGEGESNADMEAEEDVGDNQQDDQLSNP